MIYSVAAGSFKSSEAFPPVLVKSVDILADPDDRFKFKVDLLIQDTRPPEETTPFGILVAAVLEEDYLGLLKSHKSRITGLIKMITNQRTSTSILDRAFGREDIQLASAQLLSYRGFGEADGGMVAYASGDAPAAQNNLISADFEFDAMPPNIRLVVVPYGINPSAEAPPGASYGIAADSPLVVGAPIIETVVANKNIQPTTRLFRLLENSKFGKAGQLWVGPVHRQPGRNGLMAGPTHTNEPHPRVGTTAAINQKIKDYRLADAIAQLPMTSLWEEPNPQSPMVSHWQTTAPQSHFGQVIYSRSFNNQVGVMIPFNIQSYVRENFAFGKLIRDPDSLISCAKIEDIKVFRTRVQENHLGSKLTPDKNGACNDCYKIPPTLIGTLKNGQVKLLDLQVPTEMIHHIFVKDTYMAAAEQSHFEYQVEIDMVDDTPSALSLLLQSLDKALHNYEAYLRALQGDGNVPENYQTFLNANAQTLSTRKEWKALIVEFLKVVGFIYGFQRTHYKDPILWALKMLPLASPYSASIESASILKELIFKYHRRLGDMLEKTSVQKSEAPLNLNQQIGQATSSKRRLKIVHAIKETYYNELAPHVGFDYLGEFVSQGATFDNIPRQQYIQRTNAEMDKYGLTNPSSQGVNKYGFLSPRMIRTSIQDITTSGEMSLRDSYDLYQANLLPSTREKNFLTNPATFDSETFLANRILNYEGISYGRLPKPISQMAEEKVLPPSSERDTSDYFGEDSSFVLDNKASETALYGSSVPSYLKSLKKAADLVDNPLVRMALNDIIGNSTTVRTTDIEKINGSFAHKQLALNEESLASMNLFEIEINFNSVVKIEYFAGYNGSLRNQVWNILTPTQLTSLNSGERSTFLCRITDLGSVLNEPNIFKLPGFSQYFILGSPPATSGVALQSRYFNHYKNIGSTIKALMLNPMINTNTAEASVFPQYTLSAEMIYGPQPGIADTRTSSAMTTRGGSY